MKQIKNLFIGIALLLLCVTAVNAQFYGYNSFVNGYNLQCVSTLSITTNTANYGGTNVATAFGQNNYVYNGVYAASANNAYIGSNTIFGTMPAFGLQTNTGVIVDARGWPNNNSDVSSQLGIFASIVGVNNTVANNYVLSYAPVVAIPVPVGSGTITNYVAMTAGQNLFSLSLTANGLTPVNIVTNPPTSSYAGAFGWRLLGVAMTTTNAVGYSTNSYVTPTLTNGIFQNVTTTVISTNFGGVYVNSGVVGYPPFHSP